MVQNTRLKQIRVRGSTLLCMRNQCASEHMFLDSDERSRMTSVIGCAVVAQWIASAGPPRGDVEPNGKRRVSGRPKQNSGNRHFEGIVW